MANQIDNKSSTVSQNQHLTLSKLGCYGKLRGWIVDKMTISSDNAWYIKITKVTAQAFLILASIFLAAPTLGFSLYFLYDLMRTKPSSSNDFQTQQNSILHSQLRQKESELEQALKEIQTQANKYQQENNSLSNQLRTSQSQYEIIEKRCSDNLSKIQQSQSQLNQQNEIIQTLNFEKIKLIKENRDLLNKSKQTQQNNNFNQHKNNQLSSVRVNQISNSQGNGFQPIPVLSSQNLTKDALVEQLKSKNKYFYTSGSSKSLEKDILKFLCDDKFPEGNYVGFLFGTPRAPSASLAEKTFNFTEEKIKGESSSLQTGDPVIRSTTFTKNTLPIYALAVTILQDQDLPEVKKSLASFNGVLIIKATSNGEFLEYRNLETS